MAEMTQYSTKGLNSTKNTLKFGHMTPSRRYKLGLKNEARTSCIIDVKVSGKTIGSVQCVNHKGAVLVMSTVDNVKPIDIAEAKLMAGRVFRIS